MIQLPALHGLVRRRILVNFRVDPEVMARALPPPFAPQLIDGHALAGICLIRLEQLRPPGIPSGVGMWSENAAHRVAVTWRAASGERRSGVFISRRETSSRLTALAGGRLFPGQQRHAQFVVRDDGETLALNVVSADGGANLSLSARLGVALPRASVFPSAAAAADFFAAGSIGFSPGRDGRPDGLQLCSSEWRAAPLVVDSLVSSYFADITRFPPGSVTFDSALIMRNQPHQWRPIQPEARLP